MRNRKILIIMLALCMVLSMTPMTAFAAEQDVNDGENVLRSEAPAEEEGSAEDAEAEEPAEEVAEAEKPALSAGAETVNDTEGTHTHKIDGKDVAFTPWSDAKAKEQWKAWESSREMAVAAPH